MHRSRFRPRLLRVCVCLPLCIHVSMCANFFMSCLGGHQMRRVGGSRADGEEGGGFPRTSATESEHPFPTSTRRPHGTCSPSVKHANAAPTHLTEHVMLSGCSAALCVNSAYMYHGAVDMTMTLSAELCNVVIRLGNRGHC